MVKDFDGDLTNTNQIIIANDTFEQLIEAIVKNDHQRMSEDSDPFELYVDKVQARLHSNVNLFQKRFVAGYTTLLKQLKYEQSTHEISKPDDKHS